MTNLCLVPITVDNGCNDVSCLVLELLLNSQGRKAQYWYTWALAIIMNVLIHLGEIIVITSYLTGVARSSHCPVFRQSVVIPQDYVKHVPDALLTGNATDVKFEFHIRQLRRVIERR